MTISAQTLPRLLIIAGLAASLACESKRSAPESSSTRAKGEGGELKESATAPTTAVPADKAADMNGAAPAFAAPQGAKAGERGGAGGLRAPQAKPAALAAPGDGIAEFGMIGSAASAPSPAYRPVVPTREEAAPAPKLDPNARYATTYRPGGAALAAFDAAVSRGSIPASYKDLVGDFGARYAANLPKPEKNALSLRVDNERGMLPPTGGPLNLRISLRSSDQMPARAPLSVHLVLDRSGSMSGTAIENARQAAVALVEKMQPQDDFSMVTFSSSAELLAADGPVGPRKESIIAKIRAVQADGGTNISAGLDLGYAQAHSKTISPDAVKLVMLLSDGHANGGDTNPENLGQRSANAFQDGIQTSSFGLGADFDAALMSQIADRGAGGYYYLADSTQITPALNRELDARLVPVAQAVEVRLRLRPDVTPTKVFGSRMLDGREAANVRAQEVVVDKQLAKKDGIAQDRQTDAEGGMRFFMPAFARDDRHAMLVTVQLPQGVGERSIGSLEVKYKDRLSKKNVTEEIPIKIKFGPGDAESAASIDSSVAATVQAFNAGDTILRAVNALDQGDRVTAARLLQERAELLKATSAKLGEPRLGEEAQRLVRLAQATSGQGQISDPLPLAVLLRGSGYGYLR
jgi:Ca-activated chloride channel homolog